MGQTVGKAPLLPSTLPFLNLPSNIILELFEAFNDIAEGFGLTLDEFQEIVRVTLKEYVEGKRARTGGRLMKGRCDPILLLS